jgi:hypothetical protein
VKRLQQAVGLPGRVISTRSHFAGKRRNPETRYASPASNCRTKTDRLLLEQNFVALGTFMETADPVAKGLRLLRPQSGGEAALNVR